MGAIKNPLAREADFRQTTAMLKENSPISAQGHAASLAALHAEKPLRVWSLIVTIFGDLVMDEGRLADPPTMWVAPLLELLELLGIDGALARTNLSRLVANGTLTRSKAGRNSFYRLSDASRREFTQAANRIYGRELLPPATSLILAVIDQCKDRNRARALLQEGGFAMIGPTAGIVPRLAGNMRLPPGAIHAVAAPSDSVREAAAQAWALPALNKAYVKFLQDFNRLRSEAIESPAAAATARIVMVHQFRRLALRDPGLAPDFLPRQWHGAEARGLFDDISHRLAPFLRQWLDEAGFYRQPAA